MCVCVCVHVVFIHDECLSFGVHNKGQKLNVEKSKMVLSPINMYGPLCVRLCTCMCDILGQVGDCGYVWLHRGIIFLKTIYKFYS